MEKCLKWRPSRICTWSTIVIFINDLSVRLNNTGKLFADDTKVISMIKSQEDNLNLQNDINELNKWTNEWLIKFNEKM